MLNFLRNKRPSNSTGIRAAVIGAGHFGSYHAGKYFNSPRAQLVAVVDQDLHKAGKLAQKHDVAAISDFKKLPELGVVCASVASATTSHFEVASWLLKNGIDVLVEKPMTVTLVEAEELIRLAAQHKRILQVGHVERFNAAFLEIKGILKAPKFFEVRRIAPFAKRGHDVDVVMDLMIHDIDLVAYLVGMPLQRVEAVGVPVVTSNVDIANARLVFEGGAVANVTASRAAYKTERSLRIFQENTYISADLAKGQIKVYSKTGEAGEGGIPKIAIESREIRQGDALAAEVDAFLTAVETRSEPVVTGQDGLMALKVAERIRDAFQIDLSSGLVVNL